MHAWLDVTAGVAGDMVMGALVDAGADLELLQKAVRAVAGEGVTLRREPVIRAGLRATKVHVDLLSRGTGTRTWPQLRNCGHFTQSVKIFSSSHECGTIENPMRLK